MAYTGLIRGSQGDTTISWMTIVMMTTMMMTIRRRLDEKISLWIRDDKKSWFSIPAWETVNTYRLISSPTRLSPLKDLMPLTKLCEVTCFLFMIFSRISGKKLLHKMADLK